MAHWIKYRKIKVTQYFQDKIRVRSKNSSCYKSQKNITNNQDKRCLEDMVTKQEFVAQHKIFKLVENCQIVANLDNWFWNLVKLDKLKEY